MDYYHFCRLHYISSPSHFVSLVSSSEVYAEIFGYIIVIEFSRIALLRPPMRVSIFSPRKANIIARVYDGTTTNARIHRDCTYTRTLRQARFASTFRLEFQLVPAALPPARARRESLTHRHLRS